MNKPDTHYIKINEQINKYSQNIEISPGIWLMKNISNSIKKIGLIEYIYVTKIFLIKIVKIYL